MRSLAFRHALALLLSLSISACGDDSSPPDSGTPDAGDATTPRPVLCIGGDESVRLETLDLTFRRTQIGLTAGVTRHAALDLSNDLCVDLPITITASSDGVVSFPTDLTLATGRSRIFVDLLGVAAGRTTLTASAVLNAGEAGEVRWESSVEVLVSDGSVPGCEGTANGMVTPGGEVKITTGTAAGTGVVLNAGAAADNQFHVDPFMVGVACAPDQVPTGYSALGPAISFGPSSLRFRREIELDVPVSLALLPEDAGRGAVLFAYTGPSAPSARIVPVASPAFEGDTDAGMVRFLVPRLGTYQAVTLTAGPTRRDRTFTYRGITGVSMGAGGAATIGFDNPDRFDFVAPLGGPVDWVSMLHYIRTYHMGGFCTDAERTADSAACAGPARTDRTPDPTGVYEVRQDFEHWTYVDEYGGQGGTFDRHEYIQIFRDLSMMYGSLNSNTNPLSPGDAGYDPTIPDVTPPGVPDSRRMMSDADRCATPVRIAPTDGTPGTGLYDDEFNPEGAYPAITICDSAEVRVDGERDVGVWDPTGDNNYPLEVAMAFDLNDNGVRDPGEPFANWGRENFEDCGSDRLCDVDEPGYSTTNPDPNGDDYDPQYNPAGEEGNWMRDGDRCDPSSGEAFSDTGLDGVMGTPQLADGGFDSGEGDGCWNMAAGFQRMFDHSARTRIASFDAATLADLDIFSDGGIRDLFNFSWIHENMMGGFSARGMPVNYYDTHASLNFGGVGTDDEFRFAEVDWPEVGKYVHIRYGDVDASEGQLVQGDGGHVGTPAQIVNRVLSTIAWFSAKWPGGDRTRLIDRICTPMNPGCTNPNQFTFDFTAPSTGRVGPVSVVLPPGYFMDEFQDLTYPVVYFGHGYGQEPSDLVAIGIILWNFMTSRQIPEEQRLQKMIFVFPDGRCRGDECIRGTFYTDAPASTPNGAQMETFMLDLMTYMDENYRTKSSETHPVIE
ncbi:MAG: hypothetical protein GXP55_14840 [Deltaproteobacteria bacterium]|nr:hypothetical protein [Deltaproteobacteria bacterium]